MAFSLRRTRESGNRRQVRRSRPDHRSDQRTGHRTDHRADDRSSDEDADEDDDEEELEVDDTPVLNAPTSAPSTMPRGGTISGQVVDPNNALGMQELSLRPLQQRVSASSSSVNQAFATTARRGGYETRWEFSEAHRYTTNTGNVRSINVARIRQPPRTAPRSREDHRPSRNPRRDYAPGRIIEVLLVPPDTNRVPYNATSTPSDIREERPIRLRRFIVTKQNDHNFEALAIKTYQFQGVAAPGVIKSHHAVIHSTTRPRALDENERPRRNSLEAPMQNPPIRAVSWDAQRALDPKARIDYMDRYEFDYGLGNIRLWGTLHRDSEASFYAQYTNVWQTVYGPAANPARPRAPRSPSSSDTDSANDTVVPPPPQGTNPNADAGSSSRGGPASQAGSSSRGGHASQLNNPSQVGPSSQAGPASRGGPALQAGSSFHGGSISQAGPSSRAGASPQAEPASRGGPASQAGSSLRAGRALQADPFSRAGASSQAGPSPRADFLSQAGSSSRAAPLSHAGQSSSATLAARPDASNLKTVASNTLVIRQSDAYGGLPGPSSSAGGVQRSMPSTDPNTIAPSATTGVLSDEQMHTLLRKIQTEARDKQFPVPGLSITPDQLHTLAQDSQKRTTFIRRIREQWAEGSGSDGDRGGAGTASRGGNRSGRDIRRGRNH